jgi:hypothetical protein
MTNAGVYTAIVVDANGCSNVCSSTLRVNECEAEIDVIKEIVCWTPAGCDAFDGSRHAVGVKVGAQCPSFCYRITVVNTSPGNVELRDLVVTDSQLDLSSCSFPSVLPPGGSATCILSNLTHCNSVTNTVTATATGVDIVTSTVIGQRTDSDTTIGEVVPIAVLCDKFVSSPADLDLGDGPRMVTLPSDGQPYPVTYGVAVSNASALPLRVFIQDPTLANCPLPSEFSTGFPLAPGDVKIWPNICTANLQCGVDPLDEGALINTIIVSARVDTEMTNVCAYTRDGREIFTTNTCSATVLCPSPAACRTTGGGRQDADSPHGPLAWPLQGGGIECLEGMDVRYVTHGGQVGAPVGNAITFDPDSECIQGNWEHVRHAQGGRRANFHAKSFDSLLCACLGEGSEPGVVIDGVCNPDDKKNGLGPLPRKAPANKITFSGVGDYTCQKGGRAPRACLFRVDLEDRSEPGGFHPGGGKPPADRYRIRIWVLTPLEKAALDGAVNSLNDPGLCSFRRAIAATEANTHLTDGAVNANGDPVPLGTPVFGVRRPDVDDGGEMQHGNHQIHPQIKACTKPVHTCPTP